MKRASKKEVIIFLKEKIDDREYCVNVKDGLGAFKYCPASRCAYEKELKYYKYLLRMIKS